jgi:histidine ammonia-lyase
MFAGVLAGYGCAMARVVLTGQVTADDIAAIGAGAGIELDGEALRRVAANRGVLETLVRGDTHIYGITTGFGALVSERVLPELHRGLQLNLLRSHAAGTGEDLPRDVVRAAIAIRLNSLLRGHSGIRPLVLERAALMLNQGFVPCVPRSGSLGASGDLAPSAHAFLPLLGEGRVVGPEGAPISASEMLGRLGLEPLELEAKEGLALINGTHFMAGVGALMTVRVRALLDTIDLVAAITVDALRGAVAAFDARVHELRSIGGQVTSAGNIRASLAGSTRHDTGRLQDAYSLRWPAQVHGAAREAFGFFERMVAADVNAVTDNPLVFDDPPAVISAGNFHGQSLAIAFDTLRLALADLGSISERRTFRLLSPSLNGVLPAFLSPSAGPSSGYMIAQYAAAALVAELRALSHPVSVDSIPTSDNQEDHVSMGMTAAVMALESVSRVELIVAYELLCACQALDCDPGAPGELVAAAHAAVRERVTTLVEDRPPADDLAEVVPLVRDGSLARLLGS